MGRAYRGLDGVPWVRWEVDKTLCLAQNLSPSDDCSKRKSPWAYKACSRTVLMPCRRWPAHKELNGIFGGFISQYFVSAFYFSYRSFAYKLCFLVWCLYGANVCADMYGSVSLYGFLMLGLRLFLLFVIFSPILVCLFFILAWFLYF